MEAGDQLKQDVPKVSDAGLAGLAGLNKLSLLSLDKTDITDASIVQLSKFRHLKSLDIDGTKITKEGWERLAKALPNTLVSFP